MIIKGGARSKGQELAAHLMRTDTNEKVHVLGINGTAARDVRGAVAEMQAVAAGGRASKSLYHVSISPEASETLTPAQWQESADRLGAALGLEGHQRLIVLHTKEGRQHAHVVWNRVDAETLKTAHHSHNYRTHEEVARALEREFGLSRTQGHHAEREGDKPDRERPTTQESQQEARTKWKKTQAKADILAAWKVSTSGQAFSSHLEEAGYRLAQGDKRDFVVIDPAGGTHSIRSAVKGLKIAEERACLADLDRANLPTVEEARAAALAAPRIDRRPERPAEPPKEPERLSAPPIAQERRSVRPAKPLPGRYDGLRPDSNTPVKPGLHIASTAPIVSPPKVSYKTSLPAPQPTPPSWARVASKPISAPPAPKPAPSYLTAPVTPPQRPKVTPPADTAQDAARRAELAALAARQSAQWQQTLSGISRQHQDALAKLDSHHTRRNVELTGDVDKRLQELNGLASRAGALVDRAARDREIAYLVAVRQRSLAEEKARQEAVREDLKRAQAREIAEAQARHDRHAELMRQAAEERQAREAAAQARAQLRGRDGLDRS